MLIWLWKRLSDGGTEATVSGRALRRFSGREIEGLLRAGVLIEQRKADSWPVCAHCDCGLDARPIRVAGDRLLACCPRDTAADATLEPDDLRRFGIDADRLISAMAASSGLQAATFALAEGLWLLGRLPTGMCIVLCRDTHALKAPAAKLAVRAAAGTAPVTIVATDLDPTTDLQLRTAGLAACPLADCVRADEFGTERLAFDRLLPVGLAPPRLVLSRSRRSVVLDGRRLDLTPQMFALIRLFAEQAGQRDPILRKEAIEAQTGRPANEIVRDLRKALTGCGLPRAAVEALIETVRGYGYRLGLSPAAVAVED